MSPCGVPKWKTWDSLRYNLPFCTSFLLQTGWTEVLARLQPVFFFTTWWLSLLNNYRPQRVAQINSWWINKSAAGTRAVMLSCVCVCVYVFVSALKVAESFVLVLFQFLCASKSSKSSGRPPLLQSDPAESD